jgi:hypothetical protein
MTGDTGNPMTGRQVPVSGDNPHPFSDLGMQIRNTFNDIFPIFRDIIMGGRLPHSRQGKQPLSTFLRPPRKNPGLS